MSSSLCQPSINYSENVSADSRKSHYLTFLIAEEEYGVDILRVQEIRRWERATPIPNTADYVRGLINLRGSVVPVLDLRGRFKKAPALDNSTAAVIVVKVLTQQKEKTVGVLVDSVSDVRSASDQDLHPAPEIDRVPAGFVTGLVSLGANMIILINVDRLLDNV